MKNNPDAEVFYDVFLIDEREGGGQRYFSKRYKLPHAAKNKADLLELQYGQLGYSVDIVATTRISQGDDI